MSNIIITEIAARRQSGGRLVNGSNGDNGFYSHGSRRYSPLPCAEPRPSDLTLLNIVNRIFRTNCKDPEAIDATATWGVIVEELKLSNEIVSTLALRYQMGMTQQEVGKILGLPVHEIQKRCRQTMEKLRHPCRLLRLRNSIMGWPNLYRDS